MVKAVFIDYMGTTADEHSPEIGTGFQKKLRKEVSGPQCCPHSSRSAASSLRSRTEVKA